MKKVLCSCLIALYLAVGCGGSGGGRGGYVPTEVGTTPLNENSPASISGTYRITKLEFYGPGGLYMDFMEIPSFIGIYVINYYQNYMEYKMEYHDPVHGNFYDYDRVYLNEPIDNVAVDEMFYQINTDYQITIFAKNMYIPGVGDVDVVYGLTKTSDSTAPIPL